jgi:hypothetical protein
MRARLAGLAFFASIGAAVCSAQTAPQAAAAPPQPDYTAVNCSGFVSDQKVPDGIRIISAEQSNYKVIFAHGDLVHINRGQDKGVRVGDRFSIVRPDKDPMEVNWFQWQAKLMKAMGTVYLDIGQLRVVNVLPKVSVAEVTFGCAYVQRGDILLPYQDRPAPPFKDAAAFDHFAPVSGRPVAMVVTGNSYAQLYGRNSTVYVNLGSAQGVKVGDYFRIFRYQGSMAETAPQTKGYQYMMYGFGTAPEKYDWRDLPREVLGEGIVLNVNRNSSTMLITFSNIEVYAGDYVELE